MWQASAIQVDPEFFQAWDEAANVGWQNKPSIFKQLYPMPGDPGFDDTDKFLALALFPHPELGVVRVRDPLWWLPRLWHRPLETRPPSELRLKFEMRLSNGASLLSVEGGKELDAAWRRAVYLAMMRSKKHLSPRTLRGRVEVYGRFIRHAADSGRSLSDMRPRELSALVDSMPVRSLKSIYEELAWWNDQPGNSYSYFAPPGVRTGERGKPASGRQGFDPLRVRSDSDRQEPSRWRPLPDQFVEPFGALAVDMIDYARPIVNLCCEQIVEFKERSDFHRVAFEAVHSMDWPDRFRPRSLRRFLSLCVDCQTSTQSLVSLLLGPRASELLSLPGICVRVTNPSDGILVGRTYKLTRTLLGEERDWPLHPYLANAIEGQRRYVEILEGESFPYLWRSHSTILGTGTPNRGTWAALNRMVKRHGLQKWLDGRPLHHHRFRKTTVRLIVLALDGGPMILRRLLGHDDLAMTLAYIMSDPDIWEDVREMMDERRKERALQLVERQSEILGGGGETFRQAVAAAIENIKVIVPKGKRSQREVTARQVVDHLSTGPDGLAIQQIVPGLVHCFRASGEVGACCSATEEPNVANCDMMCRWNLLLPGARDEALGNVRNSLDHIRAQPDNPLARAHHSGVITEWLRRFPDLRQAFSEDPLFVSITGEAAQE